ncbi:MAG TPA: ammonia-forming cytochrome c nitrite reductase [Desulfobulbaceae bacterium]|nr:ammonia-forming cytochrome c nitrite reductase [Desulfobulbaceae bacterium]
MKTRRLITMGLGMATVSMMLLAVSVNGNTAEQKEMQAAPKIKRLESRSSEWGKHYQHQYDSYLETKKSDRIDDMLAKDPALVVLWAGYAFSKDYNAPRGHFYMLEDNINTLRTGAPVDAASGPLPTACWTCKSTDVPRLIDKIGENDFYTGKWARHGSEVVNPVGCADCHDNETMKLTLTRAYLNRALDAEGSLKTADVKQEDMRSLVCAQCHVEYYFKKTEWTDKEGKAQAAGVVTLPWAKGFGAEAMEKYYDEINFSDWTHQLSKTPMLKAQHPDYELYKTGIHGLNGVSCADCHMPELQEGGAKYSSHNVSNPLDNLAKTCLTCHEDENILRKTVERKKERRDELAKTATDVIARAHLEAGKAWQSGATEEEMKDILLDIRHAQWRWDLAVAGHGSYFHAPEETLRILASAINKGQDARVKLRVVLAKHNAADFAAPDFSTKEKAQALIELPMQKLIEEKNQFLNSLRQEWIAEGTKKGLYDPATREGIEFKASYSNK